MKLVTLSACCADNYPQINETYIRGNAFNQALTWHAIAPQENINLICCLGTDENGQKIKAAMVENGLDISHVSIKEGETSRNQLRVDEKGDRFGIEGSWVNGVNDDFQLTEADWELIAQADLINIAGHNPILPELLKRKKAGQCLSVDFLDKENHLYIEPLLEKTDIAFITVRPSDKDFYKALADKTGKLIVTTMGKYGSMAFYKGEIFQQDAIDFERIIDTTGCGDTYQAAFAYYYLTSNKDIREAMKQGTYWASLATQRWSSGIRIG